MSADLGSELHKTLGIPADIATRMIEFCTTDSVGVPGDTIHNSAGKLAGSGDTIHNSTGRGVPQVFRGHHTQLDGQVRHSGDTVHDSTAKLDSESPLRRSFGEASMHRRRPDRLRLRLETIFSRTASGRRTSMRLCRLSTRVISAIWASMCAKRLSV